MQNWEAQENGQSYEFQYKTQHLYYNQLLIISGSSGAGSDGAQTDSSLRVGSLFHLKKNISGWHLGLYAIFILIYIIQILQGSIFHAYVIIKIITHLENMLLLQVCDEVKKKYLSYFIRFLVFTQGNLLKIIVSSSTSKQTVLILKINSYLLSVSIGLF